MVPKESISSRRVHPGCILATLLPWFMETCVEKLEVGHFKCMHQGNGAQKRLRGVTEATATSQRETETH